MKLKQHIKQGLNLIFLGYIANTLGSGGAALFFWCIGGMIFLGKENY